MHRFDFNKEDFMKAMDEIQKGLNTLLQAFINLGRELSDVAEEHLHNDKEGESKEEPKP